MTKKLLGCVFVVLFLFSSNTNAQVDEDKVGAWYLYIWNASFSKESSWGVQGDIQYRNWDLLGDLEQLLIRGAVTYKPKSIPIKFALGYGYTRSGTLGPSNDTRDGSRIYQEINAPQKIGSRLYFNHRFRFEQRFEQNQDFRTRWRYGLFLNVPINNKEIIAKTFYASFYNEIFLNGERKISDTDFVGIFDRNRTYIALGYAFSKKLKVQAGIMKQSTNSIKKNQLQLSLHHSF